MAAIGEQVDITLAELAEMLLTKHGVAFAASTLWRFLDRDAMTLEKKRRTRVSRSRPASPRGDTPGSTLSLISTPSA